MKLKDASILITGGSRGLGRALGLSLAEAGARVVLVARNGPELEAAVREIQGRGGEAYGVAADVGRKEDVYSIAGQAAVLAGPVDVLIHNASTLGPVPLRLLPDTDCEDLERAFAVNVIGPFRLTKAVAGSMAVRGSGLVVSISSDAAVEAYPGWGAYGASKAAADHLSRTFAAEMDETGVRFLSVDPGEMDTAMHADAMPDADRSGLARPEDAAERIAAILRRAEEFPNGHRLQVSRQEVTP